MFNSREKIALLINDYSEARPFRAGGRPGSGFNPAADRLIRL
ncbi:MULTISPECIES: hypothetical protein [Sinorhizobium]|nr:MULTISPECIES: hypothetical protein [Sinorhizobium]